MHMIGFRRQLRAIAADHRFELAIQRVIRMVQALQALDRVLGIERELFHIHVQQLAARHHQRAADHHRMHRAAVFGMHQ